MFCVPNCFLPNFTRVVASSTSSGGWNLFFAYRTGKRTRYQKEVTIAWFMHGFDPRNTYNNVGVQLQAFPSLKNSHLRPAIPTVPVQSFSGTKKPSKAKSYNIYIIYMFVQHQSCDRQDVRRLSCVSSIPYLQQPDGCVWVRSVCLGLPGRVAPRFSPNLLELA